MELNRMGSIWDRNARNSINDNWDRLEGIMQTIDKLVIKGSLTTSEYSQLLKELNGLIKNGQVSVYDIDKNKGLFDQSFFTPEFLKQMAGTAPILSTVADGIITTKKIVDRAVTADKTDFIVENNLFDGNYNSKVILAGSADQMYHSPSAQVRAVVVKIEPDTEYEITKGINGNTFKIATFNTFPAGVGEYSPATYFYRGEDNSSIQSHKFTNTNSLYMSVQVNTGPQEAGALPTLSITKISPDGKKTLRFLHDLEGYLKLEESLKNLFSGTYDEGWIVKESTGNTLIYRENNEDRDGRTAIIPIEPDKTYTVSVHSTDLNRFILASNPTIPDKRIDFNSNIKTEIFWGYGDTLNKNNAVHTFTNNSTDRFLLVYVSDAAVEPPLQVEEGNEPTQYEPAYGVPSRYLPQFSSGPDNFQSTDFKYQFSDELYGLYGTNDVQTFGSNPGGVQASEIYSAYDELMSRFPNFITKRRIGLSAEGVDMNEYRFTQKPFESALPFKRPKIIVTSGLHGDEKSPVFSTFNMFKKICEEWQNDPILEFFRFNIDWIVIPVANPDGFNLKSRRNKNAVDLNRNFPVGYEDSQYSGSAPVSEVETPILMQFFQNHSDADFLFDFHNMFFRDEALTFGYTTDNLINDSILQTGKRLGRYWQKTYNYIPQDIDHKFVYTRPAIGGAMATYANSIGITDEIIEVVRYVGFKEGSTEFDETTVVFGVDILVNNIVTVLKNAWRI